MREWHKVTLYLVALAALIPFGFWMRALELRILLYMIGR